MVVRVTEPRRPAFQLRKGEEGLRVDDLAAIEPRITEVDAVDVLRLASEMRTRKSNQALE